MKKPMRVVVPIEAPWISDADSEWLEVLSAEVNGWIAHLDGLRPEAAMCVALMAVAVLTPQVAHYYGTPPAAVGEDMAAIKAAVAAIGAGRAAFDVALAGAMSRYFALAAASIAFEKAAADEAATAPGVH